MGRRGERGNSVNYLYQSLEIHSSGAFPISPVPSAPSPSPPRIAILLFSDAGV